MKTIICIAILALFLGGSFAQDLQPELFPHPHPHQHPHHKPPQHRHVFPGWKRSLPPLSDLPPVPPLPAGIDCKNEVGNYLINHPQGSLSSQCCSLLKNDSSPLVKNIYNQACSGSATPAPSAFAQEIQLESLQHHQPHPHTHQHPHHKPPQHRHMLPGWKRSLPPLPDLPPVPPLPAGIDCKNEVGNYLINHPQGSLSSQCCSLFKNDPSPLIKTIYNQACSGVAAPAPSAFAQEVQLESFQHPHPHPHPHQHPHHKPPQHRHMLPGWKRSLPPLSDLRPVPPLPAGIDCKNEVGNYLINHPQGSLSSQCCSLFKNDPSPLIKTIYNQACSGGAAPAPSAFAQEVQLESFQHPHPHPHPHPHQHPHHKPPQHRHMLPGWKRSLPPLSDLPPVPPLPAGIDCKNEVGNYLINHPHGSLSSQCCSLLKKDQSPLIKTIYNQACFGSAAPAPSA